MTTTIVSVSDLHIHDDSRFNKVQLLCSTICQLNPEILVFNGDIADTWAASWDEIMRTSSWWHLQRLIDWHYSSWGQKTFYIRGNHDHQIEFKIPGLTVLDHLLIPPYYFIHGWQFDVVWGGIGWLPGIYPAAFWLNSHFPRLSVRLWRLLNRGHTPAVQKARGLTEDWNRHVGVIHLRALDYAIRNKLRLVIGHTHTPATCDSVLTDDGDMVDSFTLWHLDESGLGQNITIG